MGDLDTPASAVVAQDPQRAVARADRLGGQQHPLERLYVRRRMFFACPHDTDASACRPRFVGIGRPTQLQAPRANRDDRRARGTVGSLRHVHSHLSYDARLAHQRPHRAPTVVVYGSTVPGCPHDEALREAYLGRDVLVDIRLAVADSNGGLHPLGSQQRAYSLGSTLPLEALLLLIGPLAAAVALSAQR